MNKNKYRLFQHHDKKDNIYYDIRSVKYDEKGNLIDFAILPVCSSAKTIPDLSNIIENIKNSFNEPIINIDDVKL